MLDIYSNNDWEKWNEIISSFPNYDVYYLPEYTNAFALHGDGVPLLIYFERNGFRAANVVFKRDISNDKRFNREIENNTFFDFITPYGYGGWIFDGEPSEERITALWTDYNEYCNSKGIVSELVRFHPLLGFESICANIYEIVSHGPVVCMDISDPGIIWNNLSKSKKYSVRKAIKSGVTVHNALDANVLQQFQCIYNDTMKKNKAEQYYFFGKEFYYSILNDLKENAQVFYAMRNGLVIAADIIIMAGGKINSHLGGSNPEYNEYQPQTILTYHEALWGCEHGYKTMLLGGGLGSKEDSIYQFKKGFNQTSNHVFKTGRRIFDQEKYEKLCEIRNVVAGDFNRDSSFFPEYRA